MVRTQTRSAALVDEHDVPVAVDALLDQDRCDAQRSAARAAVEVDQRIRLRVRRGGLHPGHRDLDLIVVGVRELARVLAEELPDALATYTNLLVEGVRVPGRDGRQWAHSGPRRADSFVVQDAGSWPRPSTTQSSRSEHRNRFARI
jgi:hypothetical protein